MRTTANTTSRPGRRLPSWRRPLLAAAAAALALVHLGGSSAAVGADPAAVGEWAAPFEWPIVGVHLSLTSTGQVYAIDQFGDAVNTEVLWDPPSGNFIPVPYGRNLFCAGHIQLADGRTFIAGGHVNANLGLADTTIFDPTTRTYVRGPDMSVTRWYPTVTQLPNGRVLTFAGDAIQVGRTGVDPPFKDASIDSLPSVYDPVTNSWTDLNAARLTSPLYPFMFVRSDGRIFNAGPDKTTRSLDVGTQTWTTDAESPFDGHSAVMYRPDKVMKSGAWADPDFVGENSFASHGRTAAIDLGAATPAWRETSPMALGRSYHTLTLLPDGTVLAAGGGSRSDGRDLANAVYPAEIWNPDTETWTTVASLQNGRLYHSAALLLPDGRVLMAGGGFPGATVNQKNAEIYSPPYLFKGTRPTIASAPSSVGYGESFTVQTPQAGAIDQVSLIRLPSVTHALDMNQRFQFLPFTAGSGSLTVSAPASANLAPPGDYMLFVLDGGVPSVAATVRVAAGADTTPPSAPGTLSAAGGAGTAALSWGAATDDTGVIGYNVHRSTTPGFTPTAANRIAEPSAASYTDAGLAPATYYYRVTAEDAAGNVGPASNEATATVTSGPPPGLVAAWGFDEGTGAAAADGSGKNHTGTISGATWTAAGRYGGALDFDGVDDLVTVADADDLDLTTGLTLSAWVRPTTLGSDWRTVLLKESPGSLAYALYGHGGDTGPKVPLGEIFSSGYRTAPGPAPLPTSAWTHLATTYDGSVLALYVDGVQVGQLLYTGAAAISTGALRIGGNTVWPEWFEGRIDEVRVYDRALTASEIQGDMNRPVTNPDTSPPSAPGTLAATGGLGSVALTWGAAVDDTGVARYNVHRSTASGFTPTTANRIAQVTGTSHTDTGLAAGTYFYRVTAEDASGNVGPSSNEAGGTATADTTPPTVAVTAPAGGSTVSGSVSVAASASDAGGVVGVQFRLDGAALGAEDTTAPFGISWDTLTTANGAHVLTAVARDAAGNTATSSPVSVTVANLQPPGLVAAYGFDEGSGTTASDGSGNGHAGTLGGPVWTTSGRFGGALTFDGVNDLVTVADANALDLTTGMTLEAWVRPTALGNTWRTTLMKERGGSISYALYANGSGGTKVPAAEIFTSAFRLAGASSQLALNTWTHLAAAYDGSALTLYVNGTQAGQLATSGAMAVGTGALRIGGNTIWAEWFQGQIDEVRVYNRALSAAEIQGDLARPVTNPDTSPPTAPGALTATGGLASAQLAWGAAADDEGVVLYNVHRGTSPGFTPTTANRIAQPAGTSYTDAPATGSYFYRVTAQDAAGNVGPPSNEAAATVGDVTPPSAPGPLSASGSVGRASLSWGAAADDVGVARYDVHRSTSAGFTPSAANRIAQTTTTTFVDTVAAGDYHYRVVAADAAGNLGPSSNEAAATVLADTTAPTAPADLTGSATGGTVNLSWTASTDDVGVARYNVHRGTTPGFTPTSANRIAQPTATAYADAGLAAGTYYYRVTAEDAAGNVGGASNERAVTVADGTAPSAPSGLTASASGSTVNLAWTAATDDVGVARYTVHRSATPGFTTSVLNRIAQPAATSYADTARPPGTWYYRVAAEDAAGNVSASSNEAAATIADTTPPSAPTGLTATGGAGQAALTWTAATDDVGVTRYEIHRSTVSGFTPSAATRIAQPTGTSYTDTGLAAGTWYYRVAAQDAAGNVGPPSAQATATVTPPPAVGLVGAWGFDEGVGTTTADQSGTGNAGTISGAVWNAAGRFGRALTFDGSNDSVGVADAASLDLTTGMTLEAWVRPTALGGTWRTALMKEAGGSLAYALYAHGRDGGTKVPVGEIYSGGFRSVNGTASLAANTWTHVATTYDGAVLALYVNGVQAGQLLYSGAIATSTGALRIGGNNVWGEWFQGEIDEVRIYSRARTATEIQADMNTSISSPDTVAPSAPGTLVATGGLVQVSLAWGAATDDVGVARYDVHRSTSAGFTPTAANRIAQPTGTSYTDSGLAAGTYYYKVAATDAAGNVGPASNEASGTATADTTPPTVAVSAPAAGATVSGAVTVTATASDNGSVAGVQLRLDGLNLGAEDTTSPYSTSWDTFATANGSHTLTAVARDAAGNVTTSAPVTVTVQNTASAGLVGAWALDEGSGTAAADQSGRGNNGTVANAAWTTSGRFNGAVSFNGTSSIVNVPDSATLDLTTGLTLSAWVNPSVVSSWRTVVLKEQSGSLVYGLYANVTPANVPAVELHIAGGIRTLQGTAPLPAGAWSHLAATYDGTTIRLYVNGAQVSQLAFSGSITVSTGALRIGGNNVWGEWFSGPIDEVRVYSRALAATEIQNDMLRGITLDTTPPQIAARTPAPDSAGVNAGTSATARFNEPMTPGSITATTFTLTGPGGAVAATASYDQATQTAILTPAAALSFGASYTATVKGGTAGMKDLSGNALAADSSWSFTVEASPPQILVVGSTANPFGLYLTEILANEGLNAFTTIDVAFLSPALLASFDVVLLGETALTPGQVTTLSDWVTGGGNLVAMRPDKQLAGLLGLTDAGTTLANAYLRVDTAQAPGAGIHGETMQFHGTADRYTPSGATAVATLYSSATTATASPAVTLRNVGSNGGQAAAFTFDLARSVVYTRQGNPAWSGQERDGVVGIRPNDLFYGARSGDVQPDWVDTTKIAIPQADEQQRLLLNLITFAARDRLPLPRFWYLPRDEKAVVLMSGDDHSPSQAVGGTAVAFDRFKELSPAGCSVAAWECVRSTSYVYPDATLTPSQATGYVADGFELALHPLVSSCPAGSMSETALAGYFDTQLANFRARYAAVPVPATSRTHCVYWPDWATSARVEAARGIRLDANYYHYPGSWIGSRPGFMNGGGFPMRFAETSGAVIDSYQANTNMNDEATSDYAASIATLLDNAVGAPGFYGAFGMNMHTDDPTAHPGAEAVVSAALARSVPVISYRQMLGWLDGRNASTIRALSWSGNSLTFTTTVGAGAAGLQTLLPVQGPSGTLTSLTRAGSAVPYTLETVKGIAYARFDAATATFVATYA